MVLMRAALLGGAALLAAAVLGGAAAAQDTAAPAAPAGAAAAVGAPFEGRIGGPFRLVDEHGRTRTEVDPVGRPQLLFFGYANCPGICSAVFPALAELADRLAAAGRPATPVLITVDPELDTVATLGPAAAAIHPDLVALTGDAAALAAARAAFQVESELLFVSPEHGPIHAHGGFVYLLDPQGRLVTLLPPILSPARMAEIVLGHL
jgi:protein SCO1/2